VNDFKKILSKSVKEEDIKISFNKDHLTTILTMHKTKTIKRNNKTKILWVKEIKISTIKFKASKEFLMGMQEHNSDKTRGETLDEGEGQVVVSIHLEADLIINHREKSKLRKMNFLNRMICLKN
jgi:hypothetical protein